MKADLGRPSARAWARTPPQWAMAFLLGILFLLTFTTYARYGFNTDEHVGLSRASRWWTFFASDGKDVTSSDIDLFHGPGPDAIALVLQELIPGLSYDSRHLVCALFGVSGIWFTYQLGRRFAGEWIGFFAALFLTLTPMWFGNMFLNHKDIPFAALMVASSYLSLRALVDARVSRLHWLKTGLAIGLLTATKATGLLAPPLIVAVFIACLRYVPRPEDRPELPEDFARRVSLMLFVAVLGVLASLFVFWPQLFLNGLSEWHGFMSPGRHGGWSGLYPIKYVVITTPAYILLLGALGAGLATFRRNATIVASAIVFAAIFLGAASVGAQAYGGSRHFLFAYPFLMVVAAYPVAFALERLSGSLARNGLIGAIVLCAASTIYQMYRLFPYEYSFYNVLVGGIRGADGKYDIDTWRTAHREALEKIEGRIPPGSVVRVFSCGPKIDFRMHPQIARTRNQKRADYIISLRKGRECLAEQFEGLPTVVEVQRDGVVFARIFAQRK